jgi:hypothetical protein
MIRQPNGDCAPSNIATEAPLHETLGPIKHRIRKQQWDVADDATDEAVLRRFPVAIDIVKSATAHPTELLRGFVDEIADLQRAGFIIGTRSLMSHNNPRIEDDAIELCQGAGCVEYRPYRLPRELPAPGVGVCPEVTPANSMDFEGSNISSDLNPTCGSNKKLAETDKFAHQRRI